MRKTWLQYGGVAVIVLAALIAVLPLATHKQARFDWDMAALLLIVGVMSLRKAKKLNSHPQ